MVGKPKMANAFQLSALLTFKCSRNAQMNHAVESSYNIKYLMNHEIGSDFMFVIFDLFIKVKN